MRTENIRLKAFLHYRGRVPSATNDKCDSGQASQTARHVLHKCRLFNRQRRKVWAAEERKRPNEETEGVDNPQGNAKNTTLPKQLQTDMNQGSQFTYVQLSGTNTASLRLKMKGLLK